MRGFELVFELFFVFFNLCLISGEDRYGIEKWGFAAPCGDEDAVVFEFVGDAVERVLEVGALKDEAEVFLGGVGDCDPLRAFSVAGDLLTDCLHDENGFEDALLVTSQFGGVLIIRSQYGQNLRTEFVFSVFIEEIP